MSKIIENVSRVLRGVNLCDHPLQQQRVAGSSRDDKCVIEFIEDIGIARLLDERAQVWAVELRGDLVEERGACVVCATERGCPDDAPVETWEQCARRFRRERRLAHTARAPEDDEAVLTRREFRLQQRNDVSTLA